MSHYGPARPPHLQHPRAESSAEEAEALTSEDEEQSSFGPALPPGFSRKRAASPLISPQPTTIDHPDEDESDEDEVIGPLPPSQSSEPSATAPGPLTVAQAIEARAKKMKDKLEGKDQPVIKARETWMLELPPEKTKNFGLGARQFSKSNKPKPTGDRSGWTDTPEIQAKRARGEHVEEPKAEEGESDQDVLAYLASLKRDQEMERVAKDMRQKRGEESLMEKHNQKLKVASAAKSPAEQGRRPFDRDIDLQANRFDNAQKELMMKKARQLNDRFSGGEQKFL